MEYLLENGDLFLSPDVLSYRNNSSSDHDEGDVNYTETNPLESSWTWITSFLNGSSSDSSRSLLSNSDKNTAEKSTKKNKMEFSILAKLVTKQFANGDLYSGLVDAVTGEPIKGKKVIISTGEVYEGTFQGHRKHGTGSIVYADGSKFIGRFNQDKRVEGTYVTSEFTYNGPLLEGATFHGEDACLAKKNGDVYKGDFQYGLFHGCGLQCTSEYQYKGEFHKGDKHGMGSLMQPIEDIPESLEAKCLYKYTGSWVHNSKEGSGSETLMLSNGEVSCTSTFVGNFHQNRRNGIGKLTLFDGTEVEGIWKSGIPNVYIHELNSKSETVVCPRWRITFPNGDIYDGGVVSLIPFNPVNETSEEFDSIWFRWVASEPLILPHGIGTMCYASSGDVYYGTFRMGKRHGKGVCIYQRNGDQYDGNWVEDEPLQPEEIIYPLYTPVLSENDAKYDDLASLVDSSIDRENIKVPPSSLHSALTSLSGIVRTSSQNNLASLESNVYCKVEIDTSIEKQAKADGEETPQTILSIEDDIATISSTSDRENETNLFFHENEVPPEDDRINIRGMIHDQAIFTVFTRLQD